MENKNNPIHPIDTKGLLVSDAEEYLKNSAWLNGITKREYAAIAAMQGMLSNPSFIQLEHNESVMIWISEHSVKQADKLLEHLEVTKI